MIYDNIGGMDEEGEHDPLSPGHSPALSPCVSPAISRSPSFDKGTNNAASSSPSASNEAKHGKNGLSKVSPTSMVNDQCTDQLAGKLALNHLSSSDMTTIEMPHRAFSPGAAAKLGEGEEVDVETRVETARFVGAAVNHHQEATTTSTHEEEKEEKEEKGGRHKEEGTAAAGAKHEKIKHETAVAAKPPTVHQPSPHQKLHQKHESHVHTSPRPHQKQQHHQQQQQQQQQQHHYAHAPTSSRPPQKHPYESHVAPFDVHTTKKASSHLKPSATTNASRQQTTKVRSVVVAGSGVELW
jgi:hypothetical protein